MIESLRTLLFGQYPDGAEICQVPPLIYNLGIFPDPITITYISVDDSGNTSYTIQYVHRTPLGRRQPDGTATGGVYTQVRRRFDILYEDLPFTPKPADYINDGEYVYRVIEVGSRSLQYIPVVCIIPILTYGLADTCDIYEPDPQFDDSNNINANLQLAFEGFACRLQPISTQEIDWVGKRGWQSSHVLWLYGDYDLPHRSVIKIVDKTYKVVGVEHRQQLEELMKVYLQLNP